jgi:hypothetical protein
MDPKPRFLSEMLQHFHIQAPGFLHVPALPSSIFFQIHAHVLPALQGNR